MPIKYALIMANNASFTLAQSSHHWLDLQLKKLDPASLSHLCRLEVMGEVWSQRIDRYLLLCQMAST